MRIQLLILLMLICATSSAKEEAVSTQPDPDRPIYHFQPPKNWMNDPKPFFWKGEYHIFFQYNPNDPVPRLMNWGHTVSKDLVHWTRLPNALVPTPESPSPCPLPPGEGGSATPPPLEGGGRGRGIPPDKDGCWTGCAVEKDGLFHILYTGVHPQVQCLATSKDLITWEKYESNPVLSTMPEGFMPECWRDPCAWREGDDWYMLIGSGKQDVGGTALLYKSKDLIHWDYLHPLFTGDKDRDGYIFECPDFFALGGKHVLLDSCGRTFWHVGRYEDHRFISEKQGITDGGNFYAAKTLLDDKKRRILWGWLTEARSEDEMKAAGWSGVLSLPRVLSPKSDGTLGMTPAPELKALRGRHFPSRTVIARDAVSLLDDIKGGALEIIVRIESDQSDRVGVVLRATTDLSEGLYLWIDPKQKQLVAAGGQLPEPSDRRVQVAFEPAKGEEIELHIYLDHSVLEVFANGRACLTARHYTKRTDADRVGVFGSGKCSIEAWEMKPIWAPE